MGLRRGLRTAKTVRDHSFLCRVQGRVLWWGVGVVLSRSVGQRIMLGHFCFTDVEGTCSTAGEAEFNTHKYDTTVYCTVVVVLDLLLYKYTCTHECSCWLPARATCTSYRVYFSLRSTCADKNYDRYTVHVWALPYLHSFHVVYV